MSTTPRLTLLGLYNFDDTLFSGMTMPTGIDANILRDTILLEHGEKPVLYPRADFMKTAIGIWASKWADSFERLYDALSAEYNPIHNYDRTEEVKDTTKDVGAQVSKDIYAVDVTDTYAGDSTTTATDTTAKEEKVSAYNDSTYQPDRKTENSGDITTVIDSDSTNEHKGGDQRDITSGDQRDIVYDHDAHLYGNIGVTTSQQMINEELELRRKVNLYDAIANMFAKELLLQIY